MQKYEGMGENAGSLIAGREHMPLTTLKMCDEVYASQDSDQTNKSACSVLQQVRYIQNFQSLSLPTSSTFNIPNTDILRQILVSADVSYTLLGGCSLPQGWGYALIDRLQVVINASTTYTYDGALLRNLMLLSLATRDKKSDYLALGGDRVVGGTFQSSQNSSFDIVLHVPGLCAIPDSDCKSLPLDCKMFNNISQVIVYWKDPSVVFNGLVTGMQFTRGQFIAINDVWTDSSLSLGNVLRADPSAQYLHPFTFMQTFTVPINGDSVGTSSSAGNLVTKTISGFRYGNLTGLIMSIEDPSLYTNGRPSVCAVELEDVAVIFNGVTLYNAPKQTLKLIQANNNTCLQTVQVDENNSTSVVAPVNEPLYEIQFSILDVAKNNAVVFNGLQIGNNSIQVQFRAKRLANLTATSSTVFGSQAQMKIGYLYDCALVTSQGGARTDYIF